MMGKDSLAALFVALVLIAGCAIPARREGLTYRPVDKDTEVAIEARPSGFSLFLVYSQYQWFPDLSAVRDACTKALPALAHEEADRRGRRLKPINHDRLAVTVGRNILTATTHCTGSVSVEYE
jgi:hypothetical protein